MRLDPWVRDLSQAQTLASVARMAFGAAATGLGIRTTMLEIHDREGRPVVCVTAPDISPERTATYLQRGHATDPYLLRIREVHAVVASGDPGIPTVPDPVVVAPLVGRGTVLGLIRAAAPTVVAELRRTLAAVGLHLSVRLAELGFAIDDDAELLTRRQRAVADLAAQGLSTQEIGVELHISPNTVKKHLKLVFSRLGIGSRVELAGRTGRADTRIDRLDDLREHGLRVSWREDYDEPVAALNPSIAGPVPYTAGGLPAATRPLRPRVPIR